MKQARLSIIFCVLCVTASVPTLAAKHQFRYTSMFRPFANRFYFLPLDFNASPQELSAASTHKLAFLAGLRLLRFTETDTSKVKDSLRYFEPNRSVYFTPPSVYRGTGLMSGPRVSKNPLPPGYEVLMRLDSSSTYLRSRETISGVEVTAPQRHDLDKYIELRKQAQIHRIWDSLITQYDLKKALSAGDIAGILSDLSGLKIPFPNNPLFSIFGKPQVSVNVSGDVSIRAGWRWDTQNLGTASAFGQSQSGPIFQQDINLNVSGQIGDKLRLGVDWNTRAQFDLNNRFNIGFSGEDDDIVKRVELGNVQFPTNSTLIGSGQALFGIRSDFQFGPLFLKTVASQRRGERRFVNVRGGVVRQQFALRAYDYAKNHFFVDTAYKRVWEEYYKNATPVIPLSAASLRIKELEVWESTGDPTDVQAVDGIAFADIDPIQPKSGNPAINSYPQSLKSSRIQDGRVERGKFLKVENSRYFYDPNLGHLVVNNLRSERTYAVTYMIEGDNPNSDLDDKAYGNLTRYRKEKDTLIMKLVYRRNLQPGFRTLWSRQMRNVYSIGQTNVDVNDTRINFWYLRPNNDSADVLDGWSEKLVTVLRVDQVNNNNGELTPDGLFDMGPPRTANPAQQQSGGIPNNQQFNQQSQQTAFFDPIRGEVTFPSLEPFRKGLRDYFRAKNNAQFPERFVFDAVYDTTIEVARLQTNRDRFIISGTARGTSTQQGGSNKINLGAYNLAPGSVRITLDGQQLRENQDFYVETNSGTVTLTNPRAQLPNANLNIEYEQNDAFNTTTRTLVGVRADYQLLKKRSATANIGSTFMLFDQALLFDRIRLGEEPVSNSMIGLDGNVNLNLPIVTKVIDALPFLDTKAPSSLVARAEIAAMLPTPNKRISTIASDGGQSVAYLDDFEGAQRYISLGLSPIQWTHASMPDDPELMNITDDEKAKSYFRGSTFWYQYFIGRTPLVDPFPNRSFAQAGQVVSDMRIEFEPDQRGIYNQNPNYLDFRNPTFADNPDLHGNYKLQNLPKIWGGMMRLFSNFTTNFDNENIDFIEIMMRLDERRDNGEMYIDLGQISEDVIPNQELNTEDGITTQNPIPNNIIDIGEDVGIDGVDNTVEKNTYPFPLNQETDPARDDYFFDFNKTPNEQQGVDFRFYNNFEGNSRLSESGQLPDREILNQNNGQTISLDNSYFTYKVNLDQNPATNPQIVGSGREGSGWFLYRIPIRRPHRVTGNPLFSNIQYVRVWFKGGAVKLSIADWRFTGSQWQRSNTFIKGVSPADSTLSVQFVNIEENSGAPDYYSLPPGVQRPQQLNNPDPQAVVFLNEQSLNVGVRNLRFNDERMAVRILRSTDIFFYKNIKFFLHGDQTMPDVAIPGATPLAEAIFRFGIDSGNYYEYRRPLIRGWQDIGIELAQLTALKERRDQTKQTERQEFPVPNDPLAKFAIKGNPILTRVQFIGFGIANPAQRFPNELTTNMWINELRLTDPESSTDWAGIGSLDFKIADFATVNANFQQTNPNFHRLEERFGNRIQSTNWAFQTTAALEKFLPSSWSQTKIPISYSHTETAQTPLFVAQNDVNLNTASDAVRLRSLDAGESEEIAQNRATDFRRRSETVRVRDQIALQGVKIGLPIKHWLITETIGKITIGYNYAQEFERSQIVAERFWWQWQFTGQYAPQLPQVNFNLLSWASDIPILETYKGFKINLLPTTISFSMNMNRARTTEQSRFLDIPSPVVRQFLAERSAQMNWRLTEGGLLSPIIDYNFTTGSTLAPFELNEFGQQRNGADISRQIFFNNGIINFGTSNSHTQTVTINMTPKIPDLWGLNNYLSNRASFVTTYTWRDPLQPDPNLADIVKQASWQNRITFNSTLQLKSMSDKWFNPKDSSGGLFRGIGKVLKTIFFDWTNLTPNFTQQNSSITPGVFGSTGLTNFWRGVTFLPYSDSHGPSMAYQLGLVESPHGGFNIRGSSAFPFFRFETFPGLRPPNAALQENFSQRSTIEMRTSRPLWQGATLDLNWRSEFAFNRNRLVETDAQGIPTYRNVVITETYSRTFLRLPKFLFFAPFDNTIENVIALYQEKIATIQSSDSAQVNQQRLNALSEAFQEGLEALRFMPGKLKQILPSVNWNLRWDGIEKIPPFKGIATRISLEHRYQSTYQENALINDNGRLTQGQTVQMGFQPLIGLTFTFDEKKLKGLLTGNIQYRTQTDFNLQAQNSTVASTQSQELQITGSYMKRSFVFNFLGIEFNNDMEFLFTGSYKRNLRSTFDLLNLNNAEGQKLNGDTQIIIEPSARYTVSQRLTARAFFRYETTINEGAATPGFSTTQAGVEIRLSIAGGR